MERSDVSKREKKKKKRFKGNQGKMRGKEGGLIKTDVGIMKMLPKEGQKNGNTSPFYGTFPPNGR